MGVQVVTAPTEEPVSLAEAKLHLRVVDNDEDALITGLIAAARGSIEKLLGRALVTQTWRITLKEFPQFPTWVRYNCIELPGGPAQSVETIKYTDTNGDEQELADYDEDLSGSIGIVAPVFGQGWPMVRRGLAGVRIEYVVGFGAASEVPEAIKAAIKLTIGELYANREISVDAKLSENPAIDSLLWAYRMVSL